MGKKEKVISKLKLTYCRLKPSIINGIGVFAIRDIPKSVNPFPGLKNPRWIKLNIKEMQNLDKGILKMVDDFNIIEKDGTVLVPDCGFNGMDISFFVNNSGSPNLKTTDGGFTFITTRIIKKGEELTVQYGTYDPEYKI